MPSPLSQRLKQALSEMDNPPSQAELARLAGVKPASVSDWFSGKTRRLGKALVPIARALGVTPEWLNDGRLPKRPSEVSGEAAIKVARDNGGRGAAYEIHILDAPRSCGGGRGDMGKTTHTIIKEAEWFERYGVEPDNLFGVVADGDGNADYITHGDIVIFDSSEKEPETGKIFLIRHPDGLRIKRLRRDIDGSWVLEYMNPDKHRFPDERIQKDQVETLQIEGRFVYRQGG